MSASFVCVCVLHAAHSINICCVRCISYAYERWIISKFQFSVEFFTLLPIHAKMNTGEDYYGRAWLAEGKLEEI